MSFRENNHNHLPEYILRAVVDGSAKPYVADLKQRLIQEVLLMNDDIARDKKDQLNHLKDILTRSADIAIIALNHLVYPLPDNLKVLAVVRRFEKPVHETVAAPEIVILSHAERKDLDQVFDSVDDRTNWGNVVIAGFGPGAPGLITRSAEAHLSIADIIFHDDLIDTEYLDKFSAQKVYVGKRKGKHSYSQDHINELLYQAAISGKNVVRIKGGDPLIFGRGSEEYHYLKQRMVDTTLLPGISSALAAAACAQVPLTARGISSSVVFLSAHDLAKLKIPKAETLVFFMGATLQSQLAERLTREGWHSNTPVVVVKNASLRDSEKRSYTIESWMNDHNHLSGPVIIIVGYVAACNSSEQPSRWIYTGIDLDGFREDGIPVHSPMNEIRSADLSNDNIDILTSLDQFDRVIFTSRYAVRQFFEQLYQTGLDARALHKINITSMGKVTAKELRQNGILATIMNEDESIEGLVNSFREQKLKSEKILIPCSVGSQSPLSKMLTELGHDVKKLPVFHSVMPDNIVRYNLDEMTGVIFTSPKSVEHFIKFYGGIPDHLTLKVRGKQTAKKIKEYSKSRVFEYVTTQ